MNRRILLLTAALGLAVPALNAQTAPKPTAKPADRKAMFQVYGFVRNYLGVDSRRMMTNAGGEFLLIPYDEDWNIPGSEASLYGDKERVDRNADMQSHFLALSTRVGVNLSGPQLLGASASGKVEADFAGFGSTNSVMRLRLAYVKLDWEASDRATHELVVGQDWHPLSGSVMPDVVGMAAGAPFRPHSRTPQVRYTFAMPGGLGFTAVALWQFQSTSPGPEGESAVYANRAVVPELFLGLNFRTPRFNAQVGADYTDLLVKVESPIEGSPYNAILKEHCRSLSPTLYMQYDRDLLSVKMRTTLASNLGHLGMFSGYAYAAKAPDPSSEAFRPVQAWASYVDFAYGRRVKANLFFGYHRNLGLGDDYVSSRFNLGDDMFYMKKGVKNIGTIFRVAPSVSYNTAAFNLGLEYEWTVVGYGDEVNRDATVDVVRHVGGHRLLAMVKYNF